MTLETVWFWLVGAIFAGYAVLDGFDLGVGVLHLWATEPERRTMLAAIGPVWDGNEVWLVVGGGTLFAAFPPVYATLLSGLYLPFMVLLQAFIFRAAAIEFRSRIESRVWRRTWDAAFWAASLVASLVLAVALGNVLHGLPLDATGNYRGSPADLLNPYALLLAAAAVPLFVMHGAVYLVLRTSGPLRERAAKWAQRSLYLFVALFVALSVCTVASEPHLRERIRERPWVWSVPAFMAAALAVVYHGMRRGLAWRAFLGSSATILSLFLLAGLTMYPVIVFAEPSDHALTAFNAASTPRSLTVMLIIAGIGLPPAVCYFAVVYRLFRGKVEVRDEG